MYTITLSKAKAVGACEPAYKAALNAVKDKGKPLTIEDLEAIRGLTLDDLYWAVRLTDASPLEVRRLKADNAALVIDIFEKEYPGDPRPRRAIEVARDASSTEGELAATGDAYAGENIAPEQRRLLRGFFHGDYRMKGTLLC